MDYKDKHGKFKKLRRRAKLEKSFFPPVILL